MRTQSEWIVEISGTSSWALPAGPRPDPFGFRYALARAIISRAALLVNVTARIRDGRDPRHTRCAIRAMTTRVFPVPAPASTRSGPIGAWTAWVCAGFKPVPVRDGA
jgi:hypothetical protein